MTSGAKHAPAPWSLVIEDGLPPQVFDANGNVICATFDEPTARMLVAAPEMFAALEVARRYIDAVVFNTSDRKKRNNYLDALNIIDAALSAARAKENADG